MKYIVIEESHCYADEFNTYGFTVMSKTKWEELRNRISEIRINYNNEFYFGTNEAMCWADTKDFLRGCSTKEISMDEYKILLNIFGDFSNEIEKIEFIQEDCSLSCGMTFLDRITESDEWDDEWEDDDE